MEISIDSKIIAEMTIQSVESCFMKEIEKMNKDFAFCESKKELGYIVSKLTPAQFLRKYPEFDEAQAISRIKEIIYG